MATTEWYSASLIELKALLDRIGDDGEVTLTPDDAGTAAIIAQLNASSVVYATSQLVHQSKATLALLEV